MIVAARFLRDRRRGFGWWSVGVVAMVALTVSIFPSVKGDPSIDKLVRDLPEAVRALVGPTDVSFSSAPGYLNGRLFASLAPIVLLIYAIGLGTIAIGGSEENGTLELLLANPVTRARVYAERALSALVLVLGLSAVLAVSVFALAPTVSLLDGVSITGLFGACAGAFALAALHGTIALAAGAITGRRGPALIAGTVVAIGGYLVYGLAAASDAMRPLRLVTPWHWYEARNMLVHGVAATAILLPLGIAGVLSLGGVHVFTRRDLR